MVRFAAVPRPLPVWVVIPIVSLLGLLGMLPGCDGDREKSATSPAASAPSPGDSATPVAYPTTSDIEDGGAAHLDYREYRLDGRFVVDDFCDRVAVLQRPVRSAVTNEICVFSNRTGRLRTVVVTPACGDPTWYIATAACSSRAIAWEELSPGDDLVETVSWRLYVARLDADTLRISDVTLAADGTTDTWMRPLFDLSESHLFWKVQRRGGGGERGEVHALDFSTLVETVVSTTAEAYSTVSAVDDSAVVTERTSPEAPRVILAVRQSDGRDVLLLDLANEGQLIQFPAYARGWAAWPLTLDADGDGSPHLYLREPDGTVHLVERRHTVWPAFCGDYLFYVTSVGDRLHPAREVVFGVHLATLRRFTVVKGPEAEEAYEWQGLFGAPTATHHVVLARKTEVTKGVLTYDVTLVRVYELD